MNYATSIKKPTVFVIVDFDNYFGRDVTKWTKENIEFEINCFIALVFAKYSNFENIIVRLYGGWYSEDKLTVQASQLQQFLSQISIFPIIINGKLVSGKVELAASLYEIPDVVWGYTMKEKDGIPRIRINHEKIDSTCNINRDQCPHYIMYRFTKAKDKRCHVSGCLNLQRDIYKGIEQKMVDTLLACDLIAISDDENCDGVLIFSDDFDHFPSLAVAATKINNKLIFLYYKNSENIELVKNILNPFSIIIEQI